MKTLCMVLCVMLPAVAWADSAQVQQGVLENTRYASYQSQMSPSRSMVALSAIGLGETWASFRMRLRIIVVHVNLECRAEQIFPWVHSPWAVCWAPNDVLLVCGTAENEVGGGDVIYAYDFPRQKAAEQRSATETEKQVIRKVYHEKNGHDPRA